jgi:hypothetical protein
MNMRPKSEFDPSRFVLPAVDEAGARLIEQGRRPSRPRAAGKSEIPPFGVPPLELARHYSSRGAQLSVIVHLSYYQERYRRPITASKEHCGGADHRTINQAVQEAVKIGWATAERPTKRSAWVVTLKFGGWYRATF